MRPMSLALAAVFIAALTGAALQPRQPLYAQEAASVNRVIEQLQQGRPAIGTFARTARPDLDFAVIDEQYGDFDIDGVREAVAAIRAGSGAPAVTPVVRIPLAARDAPEAVVKQVLDAGASGVMFPDIETPAQAISAVNSMRVARAAGADVWPLDPAGKLVAMLQIESLAGIENLDEILDVPGIGVIFPGTHRPRHVGRRGGSQRPEGRGARARRPSGVPREERPLWVSDRGAHARRRRTRDGETAGRRFQGPGRHDQRTIGRRTISVVVILEAPSRWFEVAYWSYPRRSCRSSNRDRIFRPGIPW